MPSGKPLRVLGINELYHDCSAALVEDGRLVAVVEEERLDRQKHTPGLCWGGDAPRRSIAWCMQELGLQDGDIDAVALSYEMNVYLAFKTVFDAMLSNARRMRLRDILQQRIRGGDHAAAVLTGNTVDYLGKRRAYLRELRGRFPQVFEIPHHLAHAASAFRMSEFDEANILVVDGLGEDCATSLYHGAGNRIRGPFRTWSQYQSLGMLYKTVTFMMGFGYFGDGKTMGLSSYGSFCEDFGDLITVGEDVYRIHLERLRKLSPHARSPGPSEKSGGRPEKIHEDIAKTVQTLLERAGAALAEDLYQRTGSRNLCIAGGVGLNCNMNSVLRKLPFVDGFFAQPGAMDMGSAIGAALEASALLGVQARDPLDHVYYGPRFDTDELERAIQRQGLQARRLADEDVPREVARRLAQGLVVGWFQGRLEFGPRALGNRSILASPASTELRDRVNRIKTRELWRPLAPSVLEEDMTDWFEDAVPSPYMNLTFHFKREQAPRVPGVVHVDGTARPQSVNAGQNPRYYALLRAFKELTGLSMVVNTSYNRREEPIVCTPDEAIASYLATDLDCLQLGDFLLEKRGLESGP